MVLNGFDASVKPCVRGFFEAVHAKLSETRSSSRAFAQRSEATEAACKGVKGQGPCSFLGYFLPSGKK